ncbi:MAG: hypothetical protein MH137_12480 [Flavobacteriales bacterium]|nr:hypothetical protein [Flavobacteriales bacterium]
MKRKIYAFICFVVVGLGSVSAHNKISIDSPEGLTYNSDGHYWTVYLVATLLNIPEAKEYAFYAEHPDNIMKEDGDVKRGTYTWLLLHKQGRVHALTGKKPPKERERSERMFFEAKDMKRKGQALHRLGDSYAHAKPDESKMYARGFGHAFTPEGGHYPDMIRNFPEKYLEYVAHLTRVLGGKDAQIDMTTFQYIAAKKLETEDNIEILKSEIHIRQRKTSFFINPACKSTLHDYLNMRASVARFIFSIEERSTVDSLKPKRKNRKPEKLQVTITFD